MNDTPERRAATLKQLWERWGSELDSDVAAAVYDHADHWGLWRLDNDTLVERLHAELPGILTMLELAPRSRRSPPPVYRGYGPPKELLTPAENRRAELVSRWIAGQAAQLDEVRRFRKDYLSARRLKMEKALGFLDSYGLGVIPLARLRELKLPAAEMSALKFRPEESTEWLRAEDGTIFLVARLGVRCEWSEGGAPVSRDEIVRVPTHAGELPWCRKEFQLPDGRSGEYRFFPGTLLAEMDRVSKSVANATFWKEPQSAWFVLTGVAPPTPGMHIDTSSKDSHLCTQGRITIEAQSWVLPSSVERVFRDAQHWMLGRGQRSIEVETLERISRDQPKGPLPRRPATMLAHADRTWQQLLRPVLVMGEDLATLERDQELMWKLRQLPLEARGKEAEGLFTELKKLREAARNAKQKKRAKRRR